MTSSLTSIWNVEFFYAFFLLGEYFSNAASLFEHKSMLFKI